MSNPSTLRSDRLRQTVVISSATCALIGSFVGAGKAGGRPIAEASGGALAADATLIAPGGPAFTAHRGRGDLGGLSLHPPTRAAWIPLFQPAKRSPSTGDAP